jgi:catechol 2,3-dioxygenase
MSYLVESIGYVAFNVRDMDAAIADSTGILGLHVTERATGVAMLSSNGRRAELVYHAADENAVGCVGLEAVGKDAVHEAGRRAREAGCRIIAEAAALPFVEAGVTIVTPEGHILEIHTPIPDGIYARRRSDTGVGPNRIDHVNIATHEPLEFHRLLAHVFGLRLSERTIDNSISFMRGANRQHHIFSIMHGAPRLHHYAWELARFSDYMRLGDLLDRHGRNFIWGPGRHRRGDNCYAYYLDAIGAMVEGTYDMARIADDSVFEPLVSDPGPPPGDPRVANCWGPAQPPEFLVQGCPFAKA